MNKTITLTYDQALRLAFQLRNSRHLAVDLRANFVNSDAPNAAGSLKYVDEVLDAIDSTLKQIDDPKTTVYDDAKALLGASA